MIQNLHRNLQLFHQGKEEHLVYKNNSGIRVDNEDNTNCFWYALTNLSYSSHPKTKYLKLCRNVRVQFTKRTCQQAACNWDEAVSVLMIPEIEQKNRCNVYFWDIDKMHVPGRTQNIYDMLLYKSEYIENQQQYQLLSNDNHYDTIPNIKG